MTPEEEMLTALTLNAACAIASAGRTARIEPGKQATSCFGSGRHGAALLPHGEQSGGICRQAGKIVQKISFFGNPPKNGGLLFYGAVYAPMIFSRRGQSRLLTAEAREVDSTEMNAARRGRTAPAR
jgi:hypothetical protein